jgi:hypothetical protein
MLLYETRRPILTLTSPPVDSILIHFNLDHFFTHCIPYLLPHKALQVIGDTRNFCGFNTICSSGVNMEVDFWGLFFNGSTAPWGPRPPHFSRLHDHTQTHHTRWDSSGRGTSSSQRPLPDNTQHSQEKDFHALGGIRTHNPSKRAAVDPRLRRHGHWNRQFLGTTQEKKNCGLWGRNTVLYDGCTNFPKI